MSEPPVTAPARPHPWALVALALGLLVIGEGALGWWAFTRGRGDPSRQSDAPRHGDADAGVRALLGRQQDAWNAGDLDGFMAGYQDSHELTFFSGGTVQKGFAALRERYRKRYQSEGQTMGTLTFSELDVTPLGPDDALARGRWKVDRPNEPPLDGLFTLSLHRFPDGWKVVHDHTSQSEKKKG